MKGPLRRLSLFCVGTIAALGWASVPIGASASGLPPGCALVGSVATCTGMTTEASGMTSKYLIEVPSNWNGTLALYSHGYEFPPAQPVHDVGDLDTGKWMLDHGYALAGSTYATTGWALEQAFQDQIALLDVFKADFGQPRRTIAWGHSLGGMITAGLVQLFPNRFTAALPMCGVVAGGPGVWNQGLDSEFAFKVLLAPSTKLVGFTGVADAAANYGMATGALVAAQATPAGRARTALSAALADVPGWFDPASPEPTPNDYTTQEANQVQWDLHPDFLFGFFGRLELESRAHGNFSWNTGVDYREQLARSTDRAEVMALYAAAGLNLEKDLDTLNDAPRIAADPKAVDYVTKFITYNGDIDMPVLTMHTTGDGLVEVTDEQAYASVVASAGDSSLLRQAFVHRAGHCSFTPAETISAFQTLVKRLDTGRWEGTDPATMNANAATLGALNFVPPSFIRFHPGQFLRRFDVRDVGDREGDQGGQD